MRLKILCGFFSLLFSSMGMLFVVNSKSGPVVPPTAPNNKESTMLSKPLDGDINTLSALENLYVSAGELHRSGSFRAESEGVTVSMGVKQGISSFRSVKGDDAFKQSVSFSSFVKLGEQRYVRGTSDYIIRPSDRVNAIDNVTWSGSATPISQQNYNELYGYVPTGLTGYILNDSTILSGELVSKENGLYTFHYVLDHTSAPYYVLYEMRTSAGTKAFPEFLRAELYVTMDSNWQVKTISTDCEYKVAMLGGTKCQENITETFYDIGKVQEVDNTEFFSQYFGQEAGEIEQKVDALTELMNIFQPYISEGKQLNVDLAVTDSKSNSLVTGKLNLLLDIENTDNIEVYAKLDNIADIAYKQGKLYVARDSFKGSATVDGLMSAVSAITNLIGLDTQSLTGSLDLDGLLAGLVVDKGDNYCNIILDTNLMGIDINAVIKSTINSDGTYTLKGVDASVAGLNINITPCGSWQKLDTNSGTYYDLVGLLDIVNDGKIAFEVNLMDKLNAHIQYDIAKNILNVKLGDIYATLQDNTVYVTFGQVKVKLALSDIDQLVDMFGGVMNGNTATLSVDQLNALSSILGDFDIDEILSSLYFDSTATTAELGIKTDSLSVAINLSVINNSWNISSINANVAGQYNISAVPTDFVDFDRVDDSQYVDIATLSLLNHIKDLINSNQFAISLNSQVVIDGTQYTLTGRVDINNGVAVYAQLNYGSLKVLDADIKIIDDVLYLRVNNLPLAFRLPQSINLSQGNIVDSINNALDSVKGINTHLDSVIDFASQLVEKVVNNKIDYSQLVKEFSYDKVSGILNIVVDGNILGCGDMLIGLGDNDKLSLSLSNWQVGTVNVSVNASVTTDAQVITVNPQDYQLNLIVRLDAINTVYANIDTLSGVFKMRMGDLNIQYKDSQVMVNYNDIAIKGDINELTMIIDKLSELANSRLQGTDFLPPQGIDFGSLFAIDFKQVLKSIKVTQQDNVLTFSVKLGTQTVTAELRGGEQPTINNIAIDLLGKHITVNTEDFTREYVDFDSLQNVVAVEEIFEDYYPVLEDLVIADGWHFDLNAVLSIGNDKYRLVEGSSIDFLYANSEDFDLKAKLIVQKFNGTDFVDYMTLNVVYLDERIYIDYNGLKLTISKDALVKTTSLLDDIKKVVPQIGELIDELMKAMTEVEGNSQTMDLSKILTQASYTNGEFTLGIDGSVLLEKLGVITVKIFKTETGLGLNLSNFVYDNITVESFNLGVDGNSREESLANIGGVTTDGYYNLDSLYELLSAFITTADNNTFRIFGNLTASLVVNVDVGIELYVDVDSDGFVFVTLQISRERLNVIQIENLAFVDYGGNSYLHYNGREDTITIVRDSYVKDGWFSTKMQYKNYYKKMTTEEFMPDIVNYLMEMINFKQWIRDEITGAMNSESQGNSFEIKDVWTGYSYTTQEQGGQFAINANLKPIDSNLGTLNLYVGHDALYNLNTMSGDMSLLSGFCNLKFSLQHTTPQYGIATDYATNETSWRGVGTV